MGPTLRLRVPRCTRQKEESARQNSNLQPPRFRDCCASDANVVAPHELRQAPNAGLPTVVPTVAEPAPSPQFPADLERLGAEWKRLSEAIKAAVLALFEAGKVRDV